MPQEMEHDPDPMETPHGLAAFMFARALVDGHFEKAHQMLASELREEYTPARLRFEYEQMFSYAGTVKADHVQALNGMEAWPAKQDGDVGWAYVSISGPDPVHGGVCNEAVAVVICEEDCQLLVREIVWGRP